LSPNTVLSYENVPKARKIKENTLDGSKQEPIV